MNVRIDQIIYWYDKSMKVVLTGKVTGKTDTTITVKTFQGRIIVIKDYEACKNMNDAYNRQRLFETN